MIYTDVFSSMFGVRGRAFAQLLSAVLGILFFGLIVWGSYEPTLHAWISGEYEGEGALRVPAWPARVVVVIGSVLVVVSYGLHARARRPLARHRPAGRVSRRRRVHSYLRKRIMLGHFDMIAIVIVLLALVFAGVHIAIALGITAALGIYLMTGDIEVVRTFVANTAYEALRDYVFAVIPLFMLMGDFLAKCGAARDLYALGNRASRWLPGRLAAATIVANALFGFVTGVSIAAAAAFSRIAYPEMRRYGYRRDFALGCVAGSACLGMLIPPSVLMIVWCVLTELSIGKLFLAGVIPGLLAAGGMIAYVVIAAKLKPELVGETHASRLAARPLGADVTSARHAPSGDEAVDPRHAGQHDAGHPAHPRHARARSGSACARRPRVPASAPSARSSWRSSRESSRARSGRSCSTWAAPPVRCCCCCSARSSIRACCR